MKVLVSKSRSDLSRCVRVDESWYVLMLKQRQRDEHCIICAEDCSAKPLKFPNFLSCSEKSSLQTFSHCRPRLLGCFISVCFSPFSLRWDLSLVLLKESHLWTHIRACVRLCLSAGFLSHVTGSVRCFRLLSADYFQSQVRGG